MHKRIFERTEVIAFVAGVFVVAGSFILAGAARAAGLL